MEITTKYSYNEDGEVTRKVKDKVLKGKIKYGTGSKGEVFTEVDLSRDTEELKEVARKVATLQHELAQTRERLEEE